MSKGNMLFSQARGKVGDLVFSRLDGEQIVRSRNRHPKNPKTNAQLFQRAIMATVLRAYAAGKMIFDHAFEGKQVGAQCQRAFLSLNAKRLRAAIATDLEGETSQAVLVAPGVANPVPWAFHVSQGTLAPSPISILGGLPFPTSGEKIGEYAERVGLINGELHTYVYFACSDPSDSDNVLFAVSGVDNQGAKVTKGGFGFVRFRVAIADADLDTVMTEATTWDKFLTVEVTKNCTVSDLSQVTIGTEMSTIVEDNDNALSYARYAGIIHSEENSGLRSDCILQMPSGGGSFGLRSQYILQAWKQGTANIGDSDLILEGGDL